MRGSTIPSPDALLDRKSIAAALTAAGFDISAATLATMRSRGGGPPAYRWGGRLIRYRWGEALEWAQRRLTSLEPTS